MAVNQLSEYLQKKIFDEALEKFPDSARNVLIDVTGFSIALEHEVATRKPPAYCNSSDVGGELSDLHSATAHAIAALRKHNLEPVFAFDAPCGWEREATVAPPDSEDSEQSTHPPLLFVEQLKHILQTLEPPAGMIQLDGTVGYHLPALMADTDLNPWCVLSNDDDFIVAEGVRVVRLNHLESESGCSIWDVLLCDWPPRDGDQQDAQVAAAPQVRVFTAELLCAHLKVSIDELHYALSLCGNDFTRGSVNGCSVETAVGQVKGKRRKNDRAPFVFSEKAFGSLPEHIQKSIEYYRRCPEPFPESFQITYGAPIAAAKFGLKHSGFCPSPNVDHLDDGTVVSLYDLITFRRLKRMECHLLGLNEVTLVFDDGETDTLVCTIPGLRPLESPSPVVASKDGAARVISESFQIGLDSAMLLLDGGSEEMPPGAVLLILWAMFNGNMDEIRRFTEMLVFVFQTTKSNELPAAEEARSWISSATSDGEPLPVCVKLAHCFAAAYTQVADVVQLLKLDDVLTLPPPANLLSGSVLQAVFSLATTGNKIEIASVSNIAGELCSTLCSVFAIEAPEDEMGIPSLSAEYREAYETRNVKAEEVAEANAPADVTEQQDDDERRETKKPKQSGNSAKPKQSKNDFIPVVAPKNKKATRQRRTVPSSVAEMAERVVAIYNAAGPTNDKFRRDPKFIVTVSHTEWVTEFAEAIRDALGIDRAFQLGGVVGYILGDGHDDVAWERCVTTGETKICVVSTGYKSVLLDVKNIAFDSWRLDRKSVTHILIAKPIKRTVIVDARLAADAQADPSEVLEKAKKVYSTATVMFVDERNE